MTSVTSTVVHIKFTALVKEMWKMQCIEHGYTAQVVIRQEEEDAKA